MLHVANSAWATTDITSSFFFALYIFLLIKTYKERSIKLAIITGIALGLAVGSKYTAAIGVVPAIYLAISHGYEKSTNGLLSGLRKSLSDRLLWTLGLVSIVIFILSTPSMITRADVFIGSLGYELGRMQRSEYGQTFGGLILSYLAHSARVSSPLMAFGFLVSVPMIVLRSRSRYEIAVLLPVLAVYIYFSYALMTRYLLLVVPLMAVLASRSIMALSSTLKIRHSGLSSAVIALVIIQAFAFTLWGVVSRYPESRSSAASYITKNIPHDASIGLAYASTEYQHGWRYPKIDQEYSRIVNATTEPEYIITSSFAADPIISALSSGKVNAQSHYRVAEKDLDNWYRRSPPSPEIFSLYDELYFAKSSKYQIEKIFRPRYPIAPIEYVAPRIEIFRRIDTVNLPSR